MAKALKIFFSLILFVIILEFISFVILTNNQKITSRSDLFQLVANQFSNQFAIESGCSWPQTITLHPFLGFVQKKPQDLSENCKKVTNVNNIGMLSDRNLPFNKKDDEYAILIVGGSVAQQFAEYRANGANRYFEDLLNKMYVPPKGKIFKTYTGAMGAWGQPAQTQMAMMNLDRIDATISLEGHNEAFQFQLGGQLEKISGEMHLFAMSDSNSLMNRSLGGILSYQYIVKNSFLKNSYFIIVTIKALQKLFQITYLNKQEINQLEKSYTENVEIPAHNQTERTKATLEKYIRAFHHITKNENINSLTVIHPTRFLGKVLTPQESMFIDNVKKENYLEIYKTYLKVKKEGFPVLDLTDVFKNRKESIYGDHIHYKKGQDERYLGHELLAQKLALEIGSPWKLKKKKVKD